MSEQELLKALNKLKDTVQGCLAIRGDSAPEQVRSVVIQDITKEEFRHIMLEAIAAILCNSLFEE